MSEVDNSKVESSLKLEDFKLSEILFNNAAKRTICLLGTFAASETDKGIIIIEKVEFAEGNFITESDEESILKHTVLKEVLVNDIYANFIGTAEEKFNNLKVSIIYPATEKHILKFTIQDLHLIEETPEIYEKVTLPHLEKEQFSLGWVYNILDHKQEVDKIIYEDSDFILLPDYKWNGQKESLYLLAIVTDRNIKSIRDLNETHLPLLENIKAKSLEAIKSKFDVDASQIRAYFHYQPSFYHLHVHFTYLKYDAPGIFCEKSHLLATVMNNVQVISNYYKKSTLTFAVREKDKLYIAYQDFIKNSQTN